MTKLDWTALSRVIVADAVVGLFDAYGVKAKATVEAPTASAPLASMIGFTGRQVRGALAIITNREVVIATQPTPTDEAGARDWLGELANQLLGRIKNRLLRYGPTLDMNIPTVVAGQHIELHSRGNSRALYRFHTPAGLLTVSLDAQLDDDFVLVEPTERETSAVMFEGELMLF